MGIYNEFGNKPPHFITLDDVVVQLKVGECMLAYFGKGDSVAAYDIPDGVYVAPEGYVVIKNQVVCSVHDVLDPPIGFEDLPEYDKYGWRL